MIKKRQPLPRYHMAVFVIILLCIIYNIINWKMQTPKQLPTISDLNLVRRDIDKGIEDALQHDKGTGCDIPEMDPFAKEVMDFDEVFPKIVCEGKDWVKCYLSQCKVVSEVLETMTNIECTYRDIIYENDFKHAIGVPTTVYDKDVYVLTESDHVKINCTGRHKIRFISLAWSGNALGYRTRVEIEATPPGREESINVLIFAYDSASRNGFMRKMPKSYAFLTQELKATVLNGYNILGDGTPAALFPLLTGKNELELPDVRKSTSNRTLDYLPFIFYKLKDYGYRTAYFEDSPWIGTFQYRLNGFSHQPTDHYLNDFLCEEYSTFNQYCIGDTPQYKLMMNITDQFFQLEGKLFCFTFIVDISHDNFNMISTADEDMVDFLRTFRDRGRTEDTMLLVMGDHGTRFNTHRDTYQGKLEERLPLMAVLLPRSLQLRRGHAQAALARNADALATPHDVHATLLDALDLTQHYHTYRVPGADLTRALTLLEPIPRNRSCSEAGIEPHWCACATWRNVSTNDKLYYRSANAFVDFINSLTEPFRDKCDLRTLTSISWLMRQQANIRMMQFINNFDSDGYVAQFGDTVKQLKENYQIKLVVGPGRGVYEASFTYLVEEDKLLFNSRHISRTNAYNKEPSCISATYPHLNMFCYCNQ